MSKRHYILPTRTSFFISNARKIENVQEFGLNSSSLNFSSSYFIADDGHVKIVWLHAVVLRKHDILHY